ncbi:uncharacterized protein LOC133508779 isoform X2 [Syngnathoides biaculeatus]|uniref:uncharacterized protein LOC133508779 isoform X2 n=1 Tax=Syngnathoides biaculeatus TaxID=300417 RepID=UPI002ADDF49A|nr:uncharacterized protein LOC133508779 isoform X2 [Syngnathoides biaculeatus]
MGADYPAYLYDPDDDWSAPVELHVPFQHSRIPDRQPVCTDLRLFSDQRYASEARLGAVPLRGGTVMILPLQPGLCGCQRGCADWEAHTCTSCGLIIRRIYMTAGLRQFVKLHVPFKCSDSCLLSSPDVLTACSIPDLSI